MAFREISLLLLLRFSMISKVFVAGSYVCGPGRYIGGSINNHLVVNTYPSREMYLFVSHLDVCEKICRPGLGEIVLFKN